MTLSRIDWIGEEPEYVKLAQEMDEQQDTQFLGPDGPADLFKQPAKHDAGKPRFELIPPEALRGMAMVCTHGAKEYGVGNWCKPPGFTWSRLYGAIQRHLTAFWAGEDIDPDSGLPHLDHALTTLAFLKAHQIRQHGRDDRQLCVYGRTEK